MHDPIVGGRRRNPLPENSSPNLRKPVKQPKLSFQPAEPPKEPDRAEANLPSDEAQPIEKATEEIREDVPFPTLPPHDPIPELWEARLKDLKLLWKHQGHFCPLCKQFVNMGITRHLYQCLPMEKFKTELQTTTSTEQTSQAR